MFALNNAATADTYTPAATLDCPGSLAQTIIVTNAAVYVRVSTRPAAGGGGVRGGQTQPEALLVPGFYDRDWFAEKLEFRSAAALTPARVTAHAD